MNMEHQICVTTDALEKLQALLDRHRLGDAKSAKSFAILEEELERAQVVEPHAVPPDVITMNSEVRLRDLESGEIFTYRLVYPSSKAQDANAVSVMAPIGMAMLGYRVGETIEWPVPKGIRRLQILEILYQPESAVATSRA
jgi:regulator of nucleoside diphosphate kinase